METLLRLPLTELISRANRVRKSEAGPGLELCNIINAKSGLCGEDCKFCAQSSRHSTDISVFPLKEEGEIVEAAKMAKEIGAQKFGIVTSGNRITREELGVIARAVARIEKEIGITVCASLGALNRGELRKLKQAGLSRYHHNIETSPEFYPRIVSTHSFEERIETIKAAKKAGLEICSGVIIGMGETWQDRINMASLLRDLEVDSIPINLLVPIKGTPFESREPLSAAEAIKAICIFRIILKDKIVKIAAGRETVLKDFQGLGFLAGANGMLIGGYLTVKGRSVEADYGLIEEVKKAWTE
jgi:biotin synthase